jgi:hypothetical protein
MYERLREFVGFYTSNYFLIFDVEQRLKYCLPIEGEAVTGRFELK